ncbi:GAF domain-containing hybrid sensor histidine kinase/response regulator [Magnetospira sp. QH-2]|uniref:GAF domain-containing hybrid sensor histidine kinase/response regulator n=1 Tax=Magnetospira sp. (strain QH-2) TaxID=1288970 RepID=UPI0003E81204|nr:GAF domain-containing hybrid sensor histidine kinase/response regulator [Magnetospira sp. QH-2]CCQ73937.1 Putative histidine kinase with sensor domain [Magnetospira sp. QH-2]
MIPAPFPENEAQRLEKLYDLNILDTLEEQAYDDITFLISRICDTPIALISLIDKDRQFLKSHRGLDTNHVSRELGFCPHAILDNDLTIVEDATKDERFHDNPLVTGGPKVRFYAGAPLIMQDNLRVGTLCVVSQEPRSLTQEQAESLQALARQVVSQLELRQSNRDLELARVEAEAASKAKSEFLSTMSHELRTPLNAILGFSQILERSAKHPLDDRQKQQVRHIIHGGEHLLRLIDDVLDLAKIEAGKLELSLEPVAPSVLINDCLTMIESLATRSDITIQDRTPTSLPDLMVDPRRAKQALTNLLSNAIKYNHTGGHVHIDAETPTANMLRLKVTDSGSGIPADKADDVFTPFTRLGADDSAIEGTGIGLALTKRLVEEIGGAIDFKNLDGSGCCFWIDFPLADSPSAHNQAAESSVVPFPTQSGPEVAEKLILYVEDNVANMTLMEEIIEDEPQTALITAPSAEVGLLMAQERQPDVILLDINLPEMDGFEALRQLRESSNTNTIPVLALSADAMAGTITRAREAGFDDYITKPFNVAQLRETLKRFLSERH